MSEWWRVSLRVSASKRWRPSTAPCPTWASSSPHWPTRSVSRSLDKNENADSLQLLWKLRYIIKLYWFILFDINWFYLCSRRAMFHTETPSSPTFCRAAWEETAKRESIFNIASPILFNNLSRVWFTIYQLIWHQLKSSFHIVILMSSYEFINVDCIFVFLVPAWCLWTSLQSQTALGKPSTPWGLPARSVAFMVV